MSNATTHANSEFEDDGERLDADLDEPTTATRHQGIFGEPRDPRTAPPEMVSSRCSATAKEGTSVSATRSANWRTPTSPPRKPPATPN